MTFLFTRFDSKVAFRDVDACWNWLGSKSPYGHGFFYLHKRTELAVEFGTARSNIGHIVSRQTWRHI